VLASWNNWTYWLQPVQRHVIFLMDKNTGNDNWGRRWGVLLDRRKRNGDRKDSTVKDKTQTRIRSVNEFYWEVGMGATKGMR